MERLTKVRLLASFWLKIINRAAVEAVGISACCHQLFVSRGFVRLLNGRFVDAPFIIINDVFVFREEIRSDNSYDVKTGRIDFFS